MKQDLYTEILEYVKKRKSCLVAIDGRCAAGKTTLAERLSKTLSASVIHMDHFFLQREQRTQERLQEPGGNVDYERFQQEVLLPLQSGKDFSYRIFDCRTMEFQERMEVRRTPVILVEGAYCCRPEFYPYWDLTVFLDVESQEQMRRIELRNGKEAAQQFAKRWIPMEEHYFQAFQVEEKCRLHGTFAL